MNRLFTLSTFALFALFCWMMPIAAQAQEVEFKAANFKEDKEGFKTAMENIGKGDEFREAGNTAFLAVENTETPFEQAIFYYKKAYAFNPLVASLNLKLGNCYLFTNQKSEAKKYIDKAFQLNKDINPMLWFYMGRTEQLNSSFKQAIKHYKTFESEAKSSTVEEYRKFTKKYIRECNTAQELEANKLRVWVDNMEDLNSPADDFGLFLLVSFFLVSFF